MEAALKKLGKIALCAVFAAFFRSAFCAGSVKFSLWTLLEPDPFLQQSLDKNAPFYQFAVDELRALAPFVAEGLAYGFEFSYTPSDSLRQVSEWFELSPIQEVKKDDGALEFLSLRAEENRLVCQAEYLLPADFESRLAVWQSIAYRKIAGQSSAPFIDGAAGIQAACREATKNAVRELARGFLKNKPKEISGTVAFASAPQIAISNGRHVVSVQLYARISKVVPYAVF